MNSLLFKIVIVFALIGGATYKYLYDPSNNFVQKEVSDHQRNVFTHLYPVQVNKIKIQNKHGTITMNLHTEKWHITERDGYPANTRRIQEVLILLKELKRIQQVATTEDQLGYFDLLDPADVEQGSGNKMTLFHQDGTTESFISGTFQSSTSEASRIFGDKFDGRQFVRSIPSNEVFLVDQSLDFINTAFHDWINYQWATEHHHQRIEMFNRDHKQWILSREKPTDLLNLYKSDEDEANSNGKLMSNTTQSIDYAFSSIVVLDIMPSEPSEDIRKQVDNDHYLEFTAFNGDKHRLYIGARSAVSEQSKQMSKANNGMLRETELETWRYVKLDWLNRDKSKKNQAPLGNRIYTISAILMDKFLLEHDEMLVFERLSPSMH